MENKEINNVAVEAVENVAEVAVKRFNRKRIGIIGAAGFGAAAIVGGTILFTKKGLPALKEKHQKRKIKKMEKKAKATVEAFEVK